jgi:hypothetical protein
MTDFQSGGINTADAGHVCGPGLEKTNQTHQALRHQLNEAVVADQACESILPVRQHLEGAFALRVRNPKP